MPPTGRAELDDGAKCLVPWTPAVEATGESTMAWQVCGLAAGGQVVVTSRRVSGWP